MADGEFDPQKIEEFLNKIRKSQDSWRFGATVVGILLALAFISSTFYQVQPEEVAVVQRFGKYIKTEGPGLQFKLPWGIDKYTKVKTQYIYKEELGFKTTQSAVRSQYASSNQTDVSLMLTGDLNMADVEWAVQFRIEDPVKFLFKVRNPGQTLRDASEAAMRLIVGDRSVDEVLTLGRREINEQSRLKLQEIMDSYETGIRVVNVELQDVDPPGPVVESFNDVNKAKQERETMVNKAREAYNKVIPRARGEAEKQISTAEGYAIKRINEAKGDAQRFIEVYKAYAASPTVTKRKLYIEMISDVLKRMKNIWIVDDKLKNVVPLLQMMRNPVQGGQK